MPREQLHTRLSIRGGIDAVGLGRTARVRRNFLVRIIVSSSPRRRSSPSAGYVERRRDDASIGSTMLANGTKKLGGVAYLLGHKQVSTTNTYVHPGYSEAAHVPDEMSAPVVVRQPTRRRAGTFRREVARA